MTRAGYHPWRNRLRDFHAELARAILTDAGYDDAMIARVASLIRKEALKSDSEAQALEDVVALVFLESYLAEFVAAHGDYEASRLADIVTKTARKMSQRGREAALSEIQLPREVAELVRNAIGGVPPGSR